MTANKIVAIINFMGSKLSEEDQIRLIDGSRKQLSVSDLEWIEGAAYSKGCKTVCNIISEMLAECGY